MTLTKEIVQEILWDGASLPYDTQECLATSNKASIPISPPFGADQDCLVHPVEGRRRVGPEAGFGVPADFTASAFQ